MINVFIELKYREGKQIHKDTLKYIQMHGNTIHRIMIQSLSKDKFQIGGIECTINTKP